MKHTIMIRAAGSISLLFSRRISLMAALPGFLILTAATLGADSAARGEGVYLDGQIVALHGDILTVHPKWGGNVIRVAIDSSTPITVGGAPGKQTSLRIGMAVSGQADKTADGLIRAQNLACTERVGRQEVVFGVITEVHDRTLQVRQRFMTDTITVTLPTDARLARQTDVDPDLIKIGTTLTIWGGRSNPNSVSTDLTAYLFLAGKETYPRARTDNSSQNDQTWTGKVTRLHPFTLKTEDADVVTVTVPGQTQYADLHPLELKELKPGGKVMLIGSVSADGVMQANDLVLGALPIVGLGD